MNYEEEYDERDERKQKPGWIKSFQNLLAKPEDDYYDEEEEDNTPKRKPISIWTDVITLDTAKEIVENLKAGEEQLVNFENTEADTENDIRYFLYGAVYALDGNIDSISKTSIVIAPKGTDIEKPDSKIRKSPFIGAFKVNG